MKETFTEWLRKQPDYGVFNPPMSSEKALDFLFDYRLVDDYDQLPEKAQQTNTYIVFNIIMKYSREFRKERKKVKREYKKMKRKNERRLKKERKHGTNKTDRNILRC